MASTYTQANNFVDGFGSSVDPRTGAFSAQLQLGTVDGNELRGPGFPLVLSYQPFSKKDFGFGEGWSLNWTVYDRADKLLSVALGEQLIVGADAVDGSLPLNQSKVTSVNFVRAGDQAYQAWHDTGEVEILTGQDDAYAVKVPKTRYGADGLRLEMSWTPQGEFYWFDDVRDGAGKVLCSAEYDGNAATVLTLWPGTADARKFELSFKQRQLTRVVHGEFIWDLGYDAGRLPNQPLLNVLRHPQGLVETATYSKEGHRYPDAIGAPSGFVPYVETYVRDPGGGQPPLTYQLTFTAKNYLGYHSGLANFSTNEDNLYDCPDPEYSYGSTVKLLSELGDVTTNRLYNKYHLLTSKTLSIDKCAHTHLYEYGYLDLSKSYAEQPANFQCATKITDLYSDGAQTRSISEQMEWNVAGHITRYLQADGIEKAWTYYPTQGEGAACPADPTGKGGFVKQITVTPPANSDAPVRRSTMTYASIAVAGGSRGLGAPMTHGIVPFRTEEYADDVLIRTTENTYINSAASMDHGRLRLYTDTLYRDGQPSATSVHYRYLHADDGSTLTIEETLIGVDGKSRKANQTRSMRTGHILRSLDADGVWAVFTYDQYGRETGRTLAPDTAYERTWSTSYSLPDGEGAGDILEASTPYGETVRQVYDGLGRELRFEKKWDGEWYTLESHFYDSRGTLARTETQDWLSPQQAEPSFQRTVSFDYDSWGQVMRASASDGFCVEQQKDPIRLLSTRRTPGLDAEYLFKYDPTTLRLDNFSRANGSGQVLSVDSYRYDGAGRLIGTTDALGRTLSYEYDQFDRVIKRTLPDGTTVVREYAAHSMQSLTVGISVNAVSLGSQKYDGLMRLTTTTNGGRTYRFSYRGASRFAAEVQTPVGDRIRYTYVPELDNSIQRCEVVGGDFWRSYDYDRYGALNSAQVSPAANGPMLEFKHDIWGRLQEETTRWATADRTASYRYSLGGRLISYTDVAGQLSTFDYDAYGRPSKCEAGSTRIQGTYDQYGRLCAWTVQDGKRELTTSLTLDAFSREVRRETVFTQGDKRVVIEQDWDKNDTLLARHTYLNGELLRGESYKYDDRGRLVSYVCDGAQLPCDPYGKQICSQSYLYDELSNITNLITVFEGGKDEASYGFDNQDDPCQLTWIRHSHSDYPGYAELRYDAAGRMVGDEQGRRLSYDALGRLVSVEGSSGAVTYGYDALDLLRSRAGASGKRRDMYYRRGSVETIVDEASAVTSFLRVAGQVVAQQQSDAAVSLACTDAKSSVLAVESGSDFSMAAYSPYGWSSGAGGAVKLGYNGELFDEELDAYHLGNGYRVYSPTLMRFTSPDAWSPFGAGGVNSYSYVGGDPINASDPSGHLSGFAWANLGLSVGLFGLAALVGLMTLGTATPIAAALIVAGMGLTGAGAVTGIIAAFQDTEAANYATLDAAGNPVMTNNGKAKAAQGWGIASMVLSLTGAALMGGGALMRPRTARGAVNVGEFASGVDEHTSKSSGKRSSRSLFGRIGGSKKESASVTPGETAGSLAEKAPSGEPRTQAPAEVAAPTRNITPAPANYDEAVDTAHTPIHERPPERTRRAPKSGAPFSEVREISRSDYYSYTERRVPSRNDYAVDKHEDLVSTPFDRFAHSRSPSRSPSPEYGIPLTHPDELPPSFFEEAGYSITRL